MQQDWPVTRDLVLVGGGHAHALVLRRWGMDPLPGSRLTLVNPGPTAPYTGMLPGFVAGHYDRDTLEIDLMALARHAGGAVPPTVELAPRQSTGIREHAGTVTASNAPRGEPSCAGCGLRVQAGPEPAAALPDCR